MGLRKCFFKEILENEKVRFKAKEKGIENDLFEKKLGLKQKNTPLSLSRQRGALINEGNHDYFCRNVGL